MQRHQRFARWIALLVVGLCTTTLAQAALILQSPTPVVLETAVAVMPQQQENGTQLYLPIVLKEYQPAITFTVNNTADVTDAKTGDGICETGRGNGVCTLRAAVLESNALPGDNTIILPASSYTLTLTDRGDHDILANLTIIGAGATTTIIQMADGINERVFDIAPSVSLNISGVTVRNGTAAGSSGGGFYNQGTLNISNSIVRDNRALRSAEDTGGDGGGIRNVGQLSISNSVLVNNTAQDDGGGIVNAGVLTLVNVTVSGNNALGQIGGNGTGGGLANLSSSTTQARSTVINSTFASNSALRSGGGIRNSGSITIQNTIVADNTAALSGNCSGTITSAGNNLENTDTCKFRAAGDRFGVNPQLGPLSNNGGNTLTHALQAGSPAIDAANNAACPATDQRGFNRPVDGNSDGSVICDIGAFEYAATGLQP